MTPARRCAPTGARTTRSTGRRGRHGRRVDVGARKRSADDDDGTRAVDARTIEGARTATLALSTLAVVLAMGGMDGDARATAADNVGRAFDGGDALFDLAGGEVPFWANMVKYARFSISIMVGFAYMFGRPVVALMKKPQTAALVALAAGGGYVFFKFTIETMLGLNDVETL
ncbi:hypothetical protein BE221DRAFT_194656 [Ostreococcus tauri]|uniref:Uncharacterized protein ycf33 n=1 Tax=Ostreococcus tauri TaxID=70448 RepID=A0A1Y5I7V7_OSTTA|nr:hypothetical protein BE221DRAFT_194656 [Ostreococcus tauri]